MCYYFVDVRWDETVKLMWCTMWCTVMYDGMKQWKDETAKCLCGCFLSRFLFHFVFDLLRSCPFSLQSHSLIFQGTVYRTSWKLGCIRVLTSAAELQTLESTVARSTRLTRKLETNPSMGAFSWHRCSYTSSHISPVVMHTGSSAKEGPFRATCARSGLTQDGC